jgi:hypothetical protein
MQKYSSIILLFTKIEMAASLATEPHANNTVGYFLRAPTSTFGESGLDSVVLVQFAVVQQKCSSLAPQPYVTQRSSAFVIKISKHDIKQATAVGLDSDIQAINHLILF